MRLGIQTKFIGILVLAAAAPLLIGLVSIQLLGQRLHQSEQGMLYHTMARYLASSVSQVINGRIDNLFDWIMLSDVPDLAAETAEKTHALSDDERDAQIQALEAKWSSADEHDKDLAPILYNDIASKIRIFQAVNPLFVEILITDMHGRLIAASNKSTDYYQADETWWQQAIVMKPRRAWVEGVHYDESAAAYTLDLAMPIYRPGRPGDPPVGVVKASLDVTPLLSSLRPITKTARPARHVIMHDGPMLLRLFAKDLDDTSDETPPDAFSFLSLEDGGWTVAKVDNEKQLIGYAPLLLSGEFLHDAVLTGVSPMHVVVHENLAVVMAPITKQLWLFTGLGTIAVLIFIVVGEQIASRKITGPIQLLRHTAQGILGIANLADQPHDADKFERMMNTRPLAQQLADDVASIDTGDEIEDLARDFSLMAKRVLNYHEHLQRDISSKTEEIQRDLRIAREFQEALLPKTYPVIPAPGIMDPVALRFSHIYHPASSVGGDFFDIKKLSDHAAGVFIADVMGHGARSALIASMLRTLLENFQSWAYDPAKFLTLVNQHFCEIVPRDDEMIYITCFYLVVNTETRTATYATAGHHAPFLISKNEQTVKPLLDGDEGDPAVGLYPEMLYKSYTSKLSEGDIIMLFTDGAIEALNPSGSEFGKERLADLLKRCVGANVTGLCDTVMSNLHRFMDTAVSNDDICLVAVEITSPDAKQTLAGDTKA